MDRSLASNIVIQGHGGQIIPGTLVTPKTGTQSTVLLFHGIFVDREENGRFGRLAEKLAERGYASLRIDLSGHGSHTTPSSETTLSGMVTDVYDTIEWSLAQFASPVDVVASSFAGALMSLYLSSFAVPIRKLVYLNPVLDLRNAFVEAEMPELAEMFSRDKQLSAWETGCFHPVPHFSMSRDMLMDMHAADVERCYYEVNRPHLVVHGTSDELISFEHTRNIVQQNPFASWCAIDGAVHAFTQSGHESIVWDAILRYLDD